MPTKTKIVGLATLAIAAFVATISLAKPNDIPAPPPLAAEDRYLSNVISVTLPGSISEVRAFMAANPVTNFLEPSGRIPRITDVDVLDGPWGAPGSLRRVDLEGGDWTHERVLTNDDDEFTYQIWDITTGSGRFIDHIHGTFIFSDVTEGTKMTWSYNIKPRFFFARPSINSFLAEDFSPFMTNGLQAFATAYVEQSG